MSYGNASGNLPPGISDSDIARHAEPPGTCAWCGGEKRVHYTTYCCESCYEAAEGDEMFADEEGTYSL